MPDYPDFTEFAYIDIWTQTLGRVLMRPTYGGAVSFYNVLNADAGVRTLLIDFSGQGMIYGAHLLVNAADTVENDQWLFTIDDNLQSAITFGEVRENGFEQPYGCDPICTRYDDINNNYSFIWPRGITFDETLKIEYSENHGRTPELNYGFSYALV